MTNETLVKGLRELRMELDDIPNFHKETIKGRRRIMKSPHDRMSIIERDVKRKLDKAEMLITLVATRIKEGEIEAGKIFRTEINNWLREAGHNKVKT